MHTKQAREEKAPEDRASVSPASPETDEEAERERRDVLLRNGVVPEDFQRFLGVFKRWRARSRG